MKKELLNYLKPINLKMQRKQENWQLRDWVQIEEEKERLNLSKTFTEPWESNNNKNIDILHKLFNNQSIWLSFSFHTK